MTTKLEVKYRKAWKFDIPCHRCLYSYKSQECINGISSRLRLYCELGFKVGKGMTCNNAKQRRTYHEKS